ncbi:transposase, partial [Ornithinibacillus bavariensis]|uniref:transposase n=1 Tax=Ornithinibacillus bavariensis TaxID=545502 RepID=UPI001BB394BB
KYIVADAGYGSEQNYEDVLSHRKRTPLITYNQYRNEKKKKNDSFNLTNWKYNEVDDSFTCPNNKTLTFRYHSKRTDKYGFTRSFKVYECEDCSGCPLRS